MSNSPNGGPAAGASEAKATTAEIQLVDMAHGGEAVGRLADGRAVFVAGGIPGETVRVRIDEERERWCRGSLVEVIEPSPHRIEAPCPHFGSCGGCQWQHIDLDEQRALKRKILVGQLQHLGKFENPTVEPVLGVAPQDGYGYRNHAFLAIDVDGRPAYHRGGSKELVAIDDCALLHESLREWMREMPNLRGAQSLELRAGTRTAERVAMLRGNIAPASEAEAASKGISFRAPGQAELSETLGAYTYRISSKSFFQVNSTGAEKLIELARERLALTKDDSLIEFYAGAGLFTLPLSEECGRLHAIESHPAALRDLRRQLRGSKVHIIAARVEDAASQIPGKATAILADPPREGLSKKAAEIILSRGAARIVLIACDPAALARDSRALVDGGYELRGVQPVDLFPQTFHIEAVATFAKV
jgi:23S rRNA (uracil1939-C5)-methyltransferase